MEAVMRIGAISLAVLALLTTCLPCWSRAQTPGDVPHLTKHGNATQLVVDGKPFLILSGELTNNAATALEPMEPIWPKLVSGNLNTVLVGVSWAQFEPEEGKFNYKLVDGVIARARENHLHIVFLWFGCWKNGTSSYPPYWVKKDYERFPRIQIGEGKTVSISGPVELLSTLSEATRDADARAFAALMGHIKELDGAQHTVLMTQVENEVGVLRDTRDRSPAANRAFAGPVPSELMNYLQSHRETLIPELRDVWAANGYKKSGTWEEVFGPGKPASLEIPIQTTVSLLGPLEHENSWQKLHWVSDEIFMAWNYARFLEKVVQAGNAAYDIPMYVNAWLQQPNHAWPGTYPSGGPLPQVHDIWRAGAPDIDILAPDLYLEYFDNVCERFIRNGNPLFVPETSTNPANAIVAVGRFNTIGFSPFGIDGNRPIPPELAATYSLLNQMFGALPRLARFVDLAR
jgi:beta-galactosidase GanA